MHDWLRSVFDRFKAGLVPVDADFGRRSPLAEKDNRPSTRRVPAEPGSRGREPDETEWIPKSILYGPPR